MLEPDAFVAAAIRLARRLGTIVRGLLRVYLPAVALVVVAAILVLYVILNAAGTQSVVASLGALAASLGITRKGLSVTVEGTIDEIRPRLWGAESTPQSHSRSFASRSTSYPRTRFRPGQPGVARRGPTV